MILLNESVTRRLNESFEFSKDSWVVVDITGGRLNDVVRLVPVKVSSIDSPLSFYGRVGNEREYEYSYSQVKYVATSEADAERWIRSVHGMTVRELNDLLGGARH